MALDGSVCGERSAYSKRGQRPACYPDEVADFEIIEFRLKHGIADGYYFGTEKEWKIQSESMKKESIEADVYDENPYKGIQRVYGAGGRMRRLYYSYPFDK